MNWQLKGLPEQKSCRADVGARGPTGPLRAPSAMSCTTAPGKSMVSLQAQVFPLKMETEYTPVSTSVVDELGDSIYG